jgi:hypothetical protein
MVDVEDVDCVGALLDAVADPVGTASRSVTPGKGPEKRFAHPVRIGSECGVAEL